MRPIPPIWMLALGASVFLAGCAATPEPPRGEHDYARAFNAAKDALRESHFRLARVDAARGVISTRPRASAGYLTPWIDHADSFGEAIEGTVQRERRVATVRFIGRDGLDPNGETPIVIEVSVQVQRVYRPGRRLDSNSIRLSSVAMNPEMRNSGLLPTFSTPTRSDLDLAKDIGAIIQSKVGNTAISVRATPFPGKG